ncbi:Sulfhydrogenase subunit delta [hydrothermal vent metagenome]|uniref:Sulfhydrogenase subunit delta n=1 Tax=hydrothermal vent metagenome TaxID=652676 RepID=A0A3B0RG25_9ZZZZ
MKTPAEKPCITFFSFTSCEGCQLVVLNCAGSFPELLKHLKIVNFREAMDPTSKDYDIAFIEGSVSTKTELEKIKQIRSNADIVIALGACSAIGGINCIKDVEKPISLKEARATVYGKGAQTHRLLKDTVDARPIETVIKVDHYLHGCPVNTEELLTTLKDVMIGRRPKVPNHPVCTDCKIAGNICVFERDKSKRGTSTDPPVVGCNGPITRGGCKAICVTYGETCWGCRGYVDDPNITAHTETLIKHGLSPARAMASLALYGSYGNENKKQ